MLRLDRTFGDLAVLVGVPLVHVVAGRNLYVVVVRHRLTALNCSRCHRGVSDGSGCGLIGVDGCSTECWPYARWSYVDVSVDGIRRRLGRCDNHRNKPCLSQGVGLDLNGIGG